MQAALGDILESRFISQQGDQAGIVVRHWLVTSTGGVSLSYTQVAASLGAAVGPLLRAVMTNAASFLGTVVRRIKPLPPSAPENSTNGAGVGSAGATPTPLQLAGLISLLTNFGGRSYRGRAYIPFPTTTSIDATGKPNAGYITGIGAVGSYFANSHVLQIGVDTVNVDPIVWSRKLQQHVVIVTYKARNGFATQRRRGAFGSPNPIPM